MAAQGGLFEPVAPIDERLERAARALWDRDVRRSGKADQADEIWPRVRSEYIAAATVCLEAANG